MAKIFLGLGSNVGERMRQIKNAPAFIRKEVNNIIISRIYESKAVGYKEQNNFLNAVIKGYTSLNPEELLKFVKSIERRMGRTYRFRWGPREIDIDILFYDDLIYKSNDIEIPHPRIQERNFVLKPLIDLDQVLIHHVYKKPITQLLNELPKEDLSIISIYAE